jgi:hypothetical protein
MKVPKYIKAAIEKNAIHAMYANQNNKMIRDWLLKKGVDLGKNEIVIDMLIDMVETQNLHPDYIKFLERYDIE